MLWFYMFELVTFGELKTDSLALSLSKPAPGSSCKSLTKLTLARLALLFYKFEDDAVLISEL